jgi:hypothetical protein
MTTITQPQGHHGDWQRLFTPVPIGLTLAFLVGIGAKFLRPERLLGLPAHPLLVHIPVVLVPILAVVAMTFAAKPLWADRFGFAASVSGLVIMLATMLTTGSGKAFEHIRAESLIKLYGARDKIPEFALAKMRAVDEHGELADTARALVALLVLLVVGQYIITRVKPTAMPLAVFENSTVKVALRVVTFVVAFLAVSWIYRTGHTGAEVTFG